MAGTPEHAPAEPVDVTLAGTGSIVRYWLAAAHVADREVLDVACGAGPGAAELLAAGATRVTAVDRASEIVEAAAAASPGPEYVVGDPMALSFDDDSFDVVTCFAEDVAPAALDELDRVLRPGGIVFAAGSATDGNLVDATAGRFAHTASFTAADASVALLVPEADLHATGRTAGDPALVGRASALDPRDTHLVVGSHEPLPDLPGAACVGDPVDIAGWEERWAQQDALVRAQAEALRELERARSHLADLRGRLLESEQTAARVPDLLAAEADNELLRLELESTRVALRHLQESPSWRLTAPLRAFKTRFRAGR